MLQDALGGQGHAWAWCLADEGLQLAMNCQERICEWAGGLHSSLPLPPPAFAALQAPALQHEASLAGFQQVPQLLGCCLHAIQESVKALVCRHLYVGCIALHTAIIMTGFRLRYLELIQEDGVNAFRVLLSFCACSLPDALYKP